VTVTITTKGKQESGGGERQERKESQGKEQKRNMGGTAPTTNCQASGLAAKTGQEWKLGNTRYSTAAMPEKGTS